MFISSREKSIAQLRAVTAAFEAQPEGGTRAVATARETGIRVLSGKDVLTQLEPDTHGKEHDVWAYEEAGIRRVWKITRSQQLLYGLSGDALSYLRRWLNSNLVFGDDIHVTGILPDGRFVISQLFIEGSVPTTIHLHAKLLKVGWQQYRNAGTVWTSPDGRIVLSEVHNGNFIERPNGEVSAIDIALHSDEEWASQLDPEEFAESYGSQYQPRSLTVMLDKAGGDLSAFGFA